MYMVDDEKPMVKNPKDKLIEDETFIVFQPLETFGLNSHEHPIIERGAIKVQGTRIVDSFSQLINPGMPIPEKIQGNYEYNKFHGCKYANYLVDTS